MGLDIHVHDTYFVVAHFHYIMVGGAIMGYLGGLHYWWPKITGRLYPEFWAKISAALVFVGFNLTFFPQFLAGYLGMPRRYHAYPPEFQVWNVMSSAGASILAVGYVLPLFYLTYSLFAGERAGADPWGAQGPRVGDSVAAADRELRGDADRHARHASVRAQQGGRHCLTVTRTRALPRSAAQPARQGGGDARTDHAPHAHHPKLQHHFDDMEQQAEASTLGMWVFLVTEIMFFGGLFMAYLVYRLGQPDGVPGSQRHLNIVWGAVNTVVLIVSSLTMALAVRAAQTSAPPKTQVAWLVATMVLGAAFLGVKVVEYARQVRATTSCPARNFDSGPTPEHAAGAEMFYSLYFCMTGLHALHMIIGLGIMAVIAIMAWRGKFDADYYTPVEVSGLYWHFVDIVWIFLFPLLYLIGGHYGAGTLTTPCRSPRRFDEACITAVFAALIVGTVADRPRSRSSTSAS